MVSLISGIYDVNKNEKLFFVVSFNGSVTVYKVLHIPDNIVHLAFCFKLKENMYFPVVERDSATKEVSIKVILYKHAFYNL